MSWGMPNSRKRRRQKDKGHRRSGNPAISDRDRAKALAELPILQATDAAEARGDAAAALELIAQDLDQRKEPTFWRPERMRRLLRLVAFGPMLPGWVTSRWILAQAAQHLDPRTRTRGLKAMEIAIETRGGVATLRGMDDQDARAKVIDHDWVFRQVWLYELGALEHFVTRVASPDLLAGADHIHEWMRTQMGAFRLVGESPQTLTLVDMSTGLRVEALNIGSATLLEMEDCAIGRLVPIADGAMFESAPLYVPENVALRVAQEPGDWIGAVAAGCRDAGEEGLPSLITAMPDFGMVTDVPHLLQLRLAVEVARGRDEELTPQALTPERLLASRVTLVRAALDDWMPVTDWEDKKWPIVAATLLDPAVFADLATGLTAADGARVRELADRLVSPADWVCHELALDLDSAA